jgi:hypothetical protein
VHGCPAPAADPDSPADVGSTRQSPWGERRSRTTTVTQEDVHPATGDKAVGTDVVRSMAQRAGAVITETEGSRVFFIPRPQVVADVILHAVDALSRGAVSRAGATV